MISYLAGTVIDQQDHTICLKVNQVGYEIMLMPRTLLQLTLDDSCELWTHCVIREDSQQLFGFLQQTERLLFRQLIKVNGIGPKVAMAILNDLTPAALVTAVRNQAISTLVRIPGIGKKTAERLLIELRDRIAQWNIPISHATQQDATTNVNDAIAALTALGYKPQQAQQVISHLAPTTSTEALVRQALQQLAQGE